MNGLNRAIIAGNLARDPEVRRTVNKRTVARFSVAVNYRYRDNNGEYKDMVDYIAVAVWGNQADPCEKYLKKGSPVLVEGRITSRSYDANDGTKRYVTEVNAEKVIFLGSGKGSSGGQASSSSSSSSPQGYGADIQASSSFGTNIGENGFGGESFTQDFVPNDNNNMPDGDTGTDIPF